jgi:AraC-like DNA-binding protein
VYLEVHSGLVFCARPALWGLALWGRPSAEDVGRILPLLAVQLAPSVVPHAMLADMRHVEDANPSAFHVLCRFLQENTEAMGRQVTRVALVRPPGFQGMVVAGFHEVVGGRYPVGIFAEPSAAMSWVDGSDLAAEIETVIEVARSTPLSVAELRRWLDQDVADATLQRAARAIRRTPRSLQRDLRAVNSSFKREVEAARVRRAKRLLARTDKPLTDIAYEIGCASPQHFSVLFRRVVGRAPSAWRALHQPRR